MSMTGSTRRMRAATARSEKFFSIIPNGWWRLFKRIAVLPSMHSAWPVIRSDSPAGGTRRWAGLFNRGVNGFLMLLVIAWSLCPVLTMHCGASRTPPVAKLAGKQPRPHRGSDGLASGRKHYGTGI